MKLMTVLISSLLVYLVITTKKQKRWIADKVRNFFDNVLSKHIMKLVYLLLFTVFIYSALIYSFFVDSGVIKLYATILPLFLSLGAIAVVYKSRRFIQELNQ